MDLKEIVVPIRDQGIRVQGIRDQDTTDRDILALGTPNLGMTIMVVTVKSK